jgi:hypothetical protein
MKGQMQCDILQDQSSRQKLLRASFRLTGLDLKVNQLALELRNGGLQRRFVFTWLKVVWFV